MIRRSQPSLTVVEVSVDTGGVVLGAAVVIGVAVGTGVDGAAVTVGSGVTVTVGPEIGVGVNPIVQASLKFSVVPVFTADKIEPVKKALCGLKTLTGSAKSKPVYSSSPDWLR